jgi:hypothetical protein
MPHPSPGESRDKYIPRCISTLMHEKPDRDHKQAIAICFSMWKQAHEQESLINRIDLYLDEKVLTMKAWQKQGREDLKNRSPIGAYHREVARRQRSERAKAAIAKKREQGK